MINYLKMKEDHLNSKLPKSEFSISRF